MHEHLIAPLASVLPSTFQCSELSSRSYLSGTQQERHRVEARSQAAAARRASYPLNHGWNVATPTDNNAEQDSTSPKCDIDVRSGDIGVADFLAHYFLPGRPVLLKGLLAHDSRFADMLADWTRHSLTRSEEGRELGDTIHVDSIIPYAAAFGRPEEGKGGSLRDYIERHMGGGGGAEPVEERELQSYVFSSVPPSSPLLRHFHTPELFAEKSLNVTVSRYQYYIGPPGSGAPLHYHGPAWNGLAYGEKLWRLLPPASAVYSRVSERVTEESQRKGLECVQEEGDVLYVPALWAHGTVNLRECVGFAAELQWRGLHYSPDEGYFPMRERSSSTATE